MNPEDLLHNLKELLANINGVNVIEVKGNLVYLEIEFTVTDALSRLLIFYSAEAANITLAVWSKCDPCSDESKLNPEEGLIYAFRSGPNSDAISEFSGLGVHLTWSMYKCGLISSNEKKGIVSYLGQSAEAPNQAHQRDGRFAPAPVLKRYEQNETAS